MLNRGVPAVCVDPIVNLLQGIAVHESVREADGL